MDDTDRAIMTEDFGDHPVMIEAAGVSLARRPRLYWCDWELLGGECVHIRPWTKSGLAAFREVEISAHVDPKIYLQPGSAKASSEPFPTFTTARPRSHPGRRPAGLERLSEEERHAWEEDSFRFPPYQYQKMLGIVDSNGHHRLPSIREREVIMGFPKDYTVQCMSKQFHGQTKHEDERYSLIGNSWNVTVVAWLLGQLGHQLGLCPLLTPQQAVQATSPGSSTTLSGLLQRQSMKKMLKANSQGEGTLVAKLLNLVSPKGEDIMVQASTEETLRYHRLRASLPASLWTWKTIMGWHWRGSAEHINVLELRAVLTSLRWRIVKRRAIRSKFVHMIDSLVCLRSLSRGRSSSRKLRRTMSRVNALLLASGSHAVWAYVHTGDNPADRPSRRPVRKKW